MTFKPLYVRLISDVVPNAFANEEWIQEMACLIKKKIRNRIYYYLAESARVDGKPRIVSQRYLGTADKVAEALSSSQSIPAPEYSIVQDFGAVLALYDIGLLTISATSNNCFS